MTGRVLIALLLLLHVLFPSICFANELVAINSLDSPVMVSSFWRMQTGDYHNWADVDFDDSAWKVACEREDCQDLLTNEYEGYIWYRLHVKVDKALQNIRLGVSFFAETYGSYEVFVNGQRIGSFGHSVDQQQACIILPKAFSIPTELVGSKPEMVIAVRAWANYRLSGLRANRKHHIIYGSQVGNYTTLESFVLNSRLKLFKGDLLNLLITIFSTVIGLFYLYLYSQRKELKEYLWFALTGLSVSINSTTSYLWLIEYLQIPYVTCLRLRITLIALVMIFGIEFLWTFLHQKINILLRIYQLSFLTFISLAILAPTNSFPNTGRLNLFLVPFMLVGTWLVCSQVWKGNKDAKTILFGLISIIFFQSCLLLERFKILQINREIGQIFLDLAFLGFYIAMMLSLSNRFSKAYRQLDELNRDLEKKVEERTTELDRKNLELERNLKKLEIAKQEVERKNEELIASQKQADRIFSTLAKALPGTILDSKYQLDEEIGSGGFGIVFKGTHLPLSRPIAIKVFKPSQGNDSADAIERFKMEGVSASRLSHKNIVTILDSGISQEGIAYLVMELLHGRSLTKELDSAHRISLRRTCLILAQVCGALTEAHRHGIVHRDIKPDNIFLTQSSEGEIVKVVDFGISKRLVESNMESYYLTAKGGILGTPAYMSPERLAGAKYDEKADIYSVGIVFYEMVCGQPPFLFNTISSRNALWKHINEDPPSLKIYNSAVPDEVDKLILTILSRNPQDRPSAEILRQKLLLFAEEYKEIVFTRRLKKFSSAAADTLIRETPTINPFAQSEDRSFVDEE